MQQYAFNVLMLRITKEFRVNKQWCEKVNKHDVFEYFFNINIRSNFIYILFYKIKRILNFRKLSLNCLKKNCTMIYLDSFYSIKSLFIYIFWL